MGKTILIILILVVVLLGVWYLTKGSPETAQEVINEEEVNDGVVEEVVGENEPLYVDLTPAEAKDLIEKEDVVIVDVSSKFADGHLPGAINYYVGDGSLDKVIPSLNKEHVYLVYCHVDEASILGAQKLIDAGFENVYRLAGNYAAWVDAGYEVKIAEEVEEMLEE